jgi:hypothetical protein
MFGHMGEAASGTLVIIKKGLMKLLFWGPTQVGPNLLS